MRLVQCEGYKANGDRCGYHGMADVRDGMYCHHHVRQCDYRTHATACRCLNCSSRITYYFDTPGVRFYCQTHKRMAQGDSSEEEETEEETEEDSSEEEYEVAPRAQYVVDTYRRTGPPYDAHRAEMARYNGGHSDGYLAQGFSQLDLYDDEDDWQGGGGRRLNIHNEGRLQVNVYEQHVHHHHHHDERRRDDCTIQ